MSSAHPPAHDQQQPALARRGPCVDGESDLHLLDELVAVELVDVQRQMCGAATERCLESRIFCVHINADLFSKR